MFSSYVRYFKSDSFHAKQIDVMLKLGRITFCLVQTESLIRGHGPVTFPLATSLGAEPAARRT